MESGGRKMAGIPRPDKSIVHKRIGNCPWCGHLFSEHRIFRVDGIPTGYCSMERIGPVCHCVFTIDSVYNAYGIYQPI